jgi:C4-type Zn-finger protein
MYREKTEKALEYLKADRELAKTLLAEEEVDEELKERAALEKEVIDHTIDVLEAMTIITEDPVIRSIIQDLISGKSINWHRLPEEQREFLVRLLDIPTVI